MSLHPFEDAGFDWLANVYTHHGAITHPSELHGLTIGEFTGGLRRQAEEWPAIVAQHMEVEALDTSRQTHLIQDLQAFYQRELDLVDHATESFELLMPDDDYPMQDRAEALIAWVSGFLEGLSMAAGSTLVTVDAELQEVLRDFVEITQLDTAIMQNETTEKELFEVCEYVKIGVLSLFGLFNPPKAELTERDETEAASASQTLH